MKKKRDESFEEAEKRLDIKMPSAKEICRQLRPRRIKILTKAQRLKNRKGAEKLLGIKGGEK